MKVFSFAIILTLAQDTSIAAGASRLLDQYGRPVNGIWRSGKDSSPGGCSMIGVLKRALLPPGPPLHIPSVEFESTGAHTSEIRTYIVHGNQAPMETQAELGNFASKWFRRRKRFPEKFIETRGPNISAYRERSIYVWEEAHALPKSPDWAEPDPVKLKGSVGLTFSQTHILDDDGGDFLLNPKYKDQHLTMEDSLGVAVPRYTDSSGNSFVVELKTYAKDPSAEHEFDFPFKLREKLRADLFTLAMASVHDYPELYEKPIFYTYGNLKSLRMYQEMGFEIEDSLTPMGKPIHYKDEDWYVMKVTPKRFEENFFRLEGARTVSHLNQAHPVELPNGIKTKASAGTILKINNRGRATFFYPANEVEIAPGFFVAGPPSKVTFAANGSLERLDVLSQSHMGIPKGSDVEFYPSDPPNSRYQIRKITLKSETMDFPEQGITAHWSVEYSPDGKPIKVDSEVLP